MADAHEQLSASELSPRWRRRFVARERLSRSLVVVPGLYMLVALVLAELIPALEGERDVLSLELDPDTARTILSAVAGGMIAFTGLVVSIAVVVVQFGASQYTPRLVSRFQRDPVVKHALGLFVAPTVFSLVSLRTITPDVAPSITILVNLVLLVVAVLAFFALVERLLDLLRPRRIIGLVVDRAAEAVHDVYPFPLGAAPPADAEPAPSVIAEVLHEGRPAVLSALDRARLVRAAKAADVRIELDVGIGGYVPTGTPLYRVCGDAARLDLAELRRAALFADERTIAQDPAFAIRAIVDLALRALSAAINDPTTAVQAIDGLEALLLELAGRDLERGRITDEEGTLRLVYPLPDWTELLDLSLMELRHYGADAPQVARRLRALLLTLRARTPDVRHAALDAHLERLDAAVAVAYADPVERAHASKPDHMGIGSPA